MGALPARLAAARTIADGRRILSTAIEAALGTRFTADTIATLRRRFRRVRFVWLMGADNLAQLPRWRRWRELVAAVPFAVFPRPGETRHALAGRAARRLARFRRPARAAAALALADPPAWLLVPVRLHAASASAIRAQGPGPAQPHGGAS